MDEAGRGAGGGEESFPPFADSLFFLLLPLPPPPPPPQELPDTQAIWGRILKSSFLLSFFSGSNDCYITKS